MASFGKIKRLSYQSGMLRGVREPSDRQLLQQLAYWCAVSGSRTILLSYRYRYDPAVTSIQLPAAMQDMILPNLAATRPIRLDHQRINRARMPR